MAKKKKKFVSQMGKLGKITSIVVLSAFVFSISATVYLVYLGLIHLT